MIMLAGNSKDGVERDSKIQLILEKNEERVQQWNDE